jgi:hypothetical protein
VVRTYRARSVNSWVGIYVSDSCVHALNGRMTRVPRTSNARDVRGTYAVIIGLNACVKGKIPLQRLPRDKVEMSRACRENVGFLIPLQPLPRIKLASNSRRLEFVCDLLKTSPTNSRQVRHKLETSCLEEVAVVESCL